MGWLHLGMKSELSKGQKERRNPKVEYKIQYFRQIKTFKFLQISGMDHGPCVLFKFINFKLAWLSYAFFIDELHKQPVAIFIPFDLHLSFKLKISTIHALKIIY